MNNQTILKERQRVIKKTVAFLKDEFNITLHLDSKTYLAGGAILSLLTHEKPNDWDFYCYTQKYADGLVSAFKNIDDKRILKTDSAITIKPLKVQLITVLAGNPEEIVDSFDFVHCKMYATTDKVYIDPGAWESLFKKKLKYTGSAYPLSALFRVKKYMKRGWDIHASDLVKIALDIVQVFSEKPKVKEELPPKNNFFPFEQPIPVGDDEITDDYVYDAQQALIEEWVLSELPKQLIGVDIGLFASFVDTLPDKVTRAEFDKLLDQAFQ